MRFKRLRKNIGISLVIFTLVVGSILLFGLAKHNNTANNQLSLGTPIYTNRGGVVQAAPQNTQPAPTQTQQPTFGFFSSGVRTRAS